MHKSQSRNLPRPIQGSIAKSNLKWIHTRKVSISKCMRESFNHHLSSIFRSSNNIFNELYYIGCMGHAKIVKKKHLKQPMEILKLFLPKKRILGNIIMKNFEIIFTIFPHCILKILFW